ncbi:hypothetical protein SAMN05216199_3715 [Pedococcus cremeus]|uniref:DUF7144 domain-containing protein n=1 Tax=Pedococcus cremeus TaxID=587636 RepID=A0A1H9XFI8_9MICO|nr:hypothetical protein [Pedococcus cremeus]SES44902.1 hypothetical protein SAMN05216199_3715 [Pedococcus cremeus]
MATTTPGRAAASTREYSAGAVGVTVFAGILMIMTGVFHAIQGIVALVNNNFFVVGKDYVFTFNMTGWGWAHLVLGVVVATAGFFLFQGATWARTVAVIAASLSIIASFLWLPYYPIWSLAVMAFDVFVIWAVTMHGRDILRAGEVPVGK